jgi:predicted RNase H-like nuclease (RuvC/YqgF family)
MGSEELIARVNKALGTNVMYKKVFDTVEDLLTVVEKQQNEYITLSQSIAEDDAIIEQLQEEVEEHCETKGLLGRQVFSLTTRVDELIKQTQQANERIKELEGQLSTNWIIGIDLAKKAPYDDPND